MITSLLKLPEHISAKNSLINHANHFNLNDDYTMTQAINRVLFDGALGLRWASSKFLEVTSSGEFTTMDGIIFTTDEITAYKIANDPKSLIIHNFKTDKAYKITRV